MKQRIPVWALTVLALSAALLAAFGGVSYARYRSSVEKEIKFEVPAPAEDALKLNADAGWQPTEAPEPSGWYCDYVLTNTDDKTELSIRLRLLASSALGTEETVLGKGAQSAENTVRVILDFAEGGQCFGGAAEIREGSLLRDEFGSGWDYRFYSDDGLQNELSIPLLHNSSISFRVTVLEPEDEPFAEELVLTLLAELAG